MSESDIRWEADRNRSDYRDDYVAYHRKAWDREYRRRAQHAARSLAANPTPPRWKPWRQTLGKTFRALGRDLALLVLIPIWLAYVAAYLAIVVGVVVVVIWMLRALWEST